MDGQNMSFLVEVGTGKKKIFPLSRQSFDFQLFVISWENGQQKLGFSLWKIYMVIQQ